MVDEELLDEEIEFREAEIPEVEPGTYEAVVADIQGIETQYGKSLRWFFDVKTAEDEEVRITGISSRKTSKRSKLYKWATAILGEELEKIKLKDLIGKECMVIVKNKNNFPSVVDVLPPVRTKKKK